MLFCSEFVRVYVRVLQLQDDDQGKFAARPDIVAHHCAFLTVSAWLVLRRSLMYMSTVIPKASTVSTTP